MESHCEKEGERERALQHTQLRLIGREIGFGRTLRRGRKKRRVRVNCEPFLFTERFGLRGEGKKSFRSESETQFPVSINLERGGSSEPTMPFGGPVPRWAEKGTEAS